MVSLSVHLVRVCLVSVQSGLFPVMAVLSGEFRAHLVALVEARIRDQAASVTYRSRERPARPISHGVAAFKVSTRRAIERVSNQVDQRRRVTSIPRVEIGVFCQFFQRIVNSRPFSFSVVPVNGRRSNGSSRSTRWGFSYFL